MNVILVPRSAGRGRHISFSPGQLLALALVMLLALPVLVGTVSYKIASYFDSATGLRDPEYVQRQSAMLSNERQAVEQARRDAELHLNALAQRLGHMQAELLRLNALGQRLARSSGLDKREFDFSEEPAMGGPETLRSLAPASVPDFIKTLEQVSGQIEKKSERLAALESTLMDKQLHAAVYPAGWPTEGGWVSSGFGQRSDPFTGRTAFHEGVDIASRFGSSIKAMGGGVVSYAGEKEGYGNTVEITHGNGYTTRYAHCKAVLVRVGDRVTKGQDVALVGTTGRSTGPHLHFEVLRDGKAVNPRTYLQSAS
jgi:murein DD-endopeptidase MepM/ murein hydrolase activator NlpD